MPVLDLAIMGQSGSIKPVIDRRYSLAEVSDGIGYLEEGHVSSKVVISIN